LGNKGLLISTCIFFIRFLIAKPTATKFKEPLLKQTTVKQSNSLDRHLTAILNSPVIETSFQKNLLPSSSTTANFIKITNDNLSQQNQFPLLNKNRSHKSYHDLILESKSSKTSAMSSINKKSQMHLNFSSKSNLYNLDKIKDSIMLKKTGGAQIEMTKTNQNKKFKTLNPQKQSQQQLQQPSRHIITLESIKPTVNILNACKSIDYIANIMKAKSELNRVISFTLIFYKHKLLHFINPSLMIHRKKLDLEIKIFCLKS